MSGAARVFLPAIRRIEQELEGPIPRRVRFLRELEYDLEALRGRLLAQGIASEEADRRALEALLPDDASLGELRRMHASWYRRVTRGLDGELLRRLERWTLATATAVVLLGGTLALARADLLRYASPFLWAVFACGAGLFATVTAKAFQLWIKGDQPIRLDGLRPILWMSGATLTVGMGGVILDLYRLAGLLERSPELAATLVEVWLVRDCALLSTAILSAMAGGLVWLVMSQWLTAVAVDRHEALGLDTRQLVSGGF